MVNNSYDRPVGPVESWLTYAWSPSGQVIIVTAVITFILPVLLHLYLYRYRASVTPPKFLVVGPSGTGKTALLTLLQRGRPAKTHTSQASSTVELKLPNNYKAASSQHRSANDPSLATHRRFQLVDTPGHGKLRYHALDRLSKLPQHRQTQSPRSRGTNEIAGVIFVIDAAGTDFSTLSTSSNQIKNNDIKGRLGSLADTASYLHDLLLILQQKESMPVLIAANKADLFTAVPAAMLRSALEREITAVRRTRASGLLDSAVGADDAVNEEWLGRLKSGGDKGLADGNDSERSMGFRFEELEESGIKVDVREGNVTGSDGPGAEAWWDWIAAHM